MANMIFNKIWAGGEGLWYMHTTGWTHMAKLVDAFTVP